MAYRQGTIGNDILEGTEDADTLEGLEGDDTFFASDGADSFLGGPGIDTVSYRNSTAFVSISPPPNSENIREAGWARGDTFDSIEIFRLPDVGGTFVGPLGGTIVVHGGSGNDTFYALNGRSETFYGGGI